jgi:hypothetical protein
VELNNVMPCIVASRVIRSRGLISIVPRLADHDHAGRGRAQAASMIRPPVLPISPASSRISFDTALHCLRSWISTLGEVRRVHAVIHERARHLGRARRVEPSRGSRRAPPP